VGEEGKELAELPGQAHAMSTLRAAAQNPVHAYLFVGPPGTGKLQAAKLFGAMLLCPAGREDRCFTCQRVLDGNHPDFLVFEREGAALTIDQAREVSRLAARSSVEGGRKVLVLPDLHLAADAIPALLKTIEEPAADAVFIGIAEFVPASLATVASRCVRVDFRPLSEAEIVEALISEGVAAERAAPAASAAGGRLDRAKLLASDPQVARRLAAWEAVPERLDGTGATIAVIANELVELLKESVAPLIARQEAEAAEATRRSAEQLGAAPAGFAQRAQRATLGAARDLAERHRREQRRQRTDELRMGLAALARSYAARAASGAIRADLAASSVELIDKFSADLAFNPGELLALQALLVRLDRLGTAQP
jgi:DNA polymerase-3 subunit delta'